MIRTLLLAALALPCIACGQNPVDPDPNGVLRKPIPDKLVVLTFDDGPASSYTVVAPILKSCGFGGSFYICDFDSFRTRKDWYLTWRQMKAMADAGLEIGNHTTGHAGGSAIGGFLSMEDDLLANGVPKPTTIAWPVFQVNTGTYPELAANGYIFGRGGHFRPYRPTVDNPFDVPCMGAGTMEEFVKSVRQAAGGRIVVLIYHGVPDIEHAACSLDPAVFKMQMQYLKDNHYQVIALRDLAQFVDPARAAKLPPTANEFKDPAPPMLAKEDKSYVAMNMTKTKDASATVNQATASTAKEMLCFVLPGSFPGLISGTSIGVYVPAATEVKALAPTFSLSNLAKADPASGTPRDFSQPQTYTVTAQDGSTQVYTVTVTAGGQPFVFTWNSAAAGNWNDASKWSNNLASGAAPLTAGRPDYVFNFDQPGNYAVTNDLSEDFMVNQLNGYGPSLKVEGKSLAFSTNGASALPPQIHQVGPGDITIATPVKLAANLTVSVVNNSYVTLGGLVSGSGGLVKNGDGQLRITHVKNTFSGGTTINRGSLYLYVANEGLGSGPITLNGAGALDLEHVDGATPLVLNGGTINAGNGFGDSWRGTITVNGNTNITAYADFVISAAISGPGGLTHIGGVGAFGPSNSGTVTLTGNNTYSGPTIARRGTLRILKAASLYHADPASWTPAKISVHPAATLVLSAGGPDEFTGPHVATLLRNLTSKINDNGLMERAVLCLNTANAKDPVVVATDIGDSSGPGGGAFLLKKCGAGTMQLTGHNTYTGQTILEGGALSVASLNSVVKGKPSSSLGSPTNIEAGEIFIGKDDGDCALIYTGKGETTDRVMNLAGKKSTVTINQSGSGLLKLTSTFVISGHGANKTIVLTGDTAGTGEIAGNIVNPHDRAGQAATAVTKSGIGTWALSGANSHTGPTKVIQGTLVLKNARSLGDQTEVSLAEGAMLALDFNGEMRVSKLYFDDKLQPAGTYGAASAPKYIKGQGRLRN
ncbi:MAG: autotransporter-associated beta strand repeat-containing protein [Verrucomicrobia bacterium]|nr:autotransporter-associated beta strand repeat-containing protein [Verrucomicrobiota bacterium]